MTREPPRTLPCAVYRQYDKAGRLLYVGQSQDPLSRFYGHRSASHWAFSVARIEVEWFADRKAALVAEAAAIRAEDPLHNPHRSRVGLSNWARNIGHLFFADWMEWSGMSVKEMAERLQRPPAYVRKLMAGAHPHAQLRERIAVVTAGHVPQKAWDSQHAEEGFDRLSPAEAARHLAHVERVIAWRKRLRAGDADASEWPGSDPAPFAFRLRVVPSEAA